MPPPNTAQPEGPFPYLQVFPTKVVGN
jgi:hypothetical protein